MGNYTGVDTSFNYNIYIYEAEDFVLGGLTGTSNIPIKQLADNSAYLKKFKGRIIRGTGDPDSNTLNDLDTDSNTTSNTLYLDENSGAFWKPDDQNGTTWTNIYKSVVMNVKQLRINNNGDDTDYFKLVYNESANRLEIRDKNDVLADVRVGKVAYNSIDGESLTQSHFADQEILLLFDIVDHTENNDAYFSVKRLEALANLTITDLDVGDQSGETTDEWTVTVSSGVLSDYISSGDYIQITGIDEDSGEEINGYYLVNTVNDGGPSFTTYRTFNSVDGTNKTLQSGNIYLDVASLIKWDETNQYWSLERRDGTLLPLNCAGFFIDGVATGFLADRVITTSAQFTELFENLDSGEDTCYLKKPETNYVDIIESEFIAIKPNVDTADGSYTLNNNVEILGNNVEIKTFAGAYIKAGANNISFKIKDNTYMPIDEYLGTDIEILSEDSYYTSGENIGEQIVLEANDNIFLFSDTADVNKKYSIVSIIKQLKEDVNISDSPGTDWTYDNIDIDDGNDSQGDFHVFQKGDKIWLAYIDSNVIYVRDYDYNSSTRTYTIGTNTINSTDGPTYQNVQIFVDDTYLYVVAAEAADLIRFKRLELSSLANFTTETVDNSSGYLYPKLYVDNGDVFIVGQDGSGNLKAFKGVDSSGFSWSNSIDFDVSNTTTFDINVSTNNVLITYSTDDESVNNLYMATSAKSSLSFSVQRLSDDATAQGNASKMLWVNSNLYVFYNLGTQKDNIYFAKVINYESTPAFDSGYPTQILNVTDSQFDYLDVKLNTDNKYPNSSTDIVQVIAFNSSTSIEPSLYSMLSSDLSTWQTKSFDLDEHDNNGYIASLYNDNLFVAYFSDGGGSGIYDSTYLLKLYYNFEITLNSSITSDITDLILSPDYKNNIYLKLFLDGNSQSLTDVINISNSINSEYEITIINSSSTNGIEANKKTYNNIVKTIIDDTNDITYNINELNHSFVIKSNIIMDSQTGAKNFNDCININIMGLIDNEAVLMNGDFNE